MQSAIEAKIAFHKAQGASGILKFRWITAMRRQILSGLPSADFNQAEIASTMVDELESEYLHFPFNIFLFFSKCH